MSATVELGRRSLREAIRQPDALFMTMFIPIFFLVGLLVQTLLARDRRRLLRERSPLFLAAAASALVLVGAGTIVVFDGGSGGAGGVNGTGRLVTSTTTGITTTTGPMTTTNTGPETCPTPAPVGPLEFCGGTSVTGSGSS